MHAKETLFRIVRLTLQGLIASAVLVGAATPALAQTWPQRAVKFVVPLGPGSGADISARLFADRLARRWGKPVFIENRPGGDGIIAIDSFVNAEDDRAGPGNLHRTISGISA
jgi:tripartite-type tricarboxylate transporter receptor subunit TctC